MGIEGFMKVCVEDRVVIGMCLMIDSKGKIRYSGPIHGAFVPEHAAEDLTLFLNTVDFERFKDFVDSKQKLH